MSTLKDFLNLCFDPDEYLWVKACHKRNEQCMSVSQDVVAKLDGAKAPEGAYLSIGAATAKDVRRLGTNVKDLRRFLIEFDEGTQSEHCMMMIESGLPFTAALSSGGKSTHFWMVLEEPLASIGEYKEWFWRMHILLNCKNDKQTSDPARFSRLPTVFRGEREQKLLKLKSRVKNAEMKALLFTPRITEKFEAQFASKATSGEAVTFRHVEKDLDKHIAYLNEKYPLISGLKQSNLMVWARTLIGNCYIKDKEELINIIAENDQGKNKVYYEYVRAVERSLERCPIKLEGEQLINSIFNGE